MLSQKALRVGFVGLVSQKKSKKSMNVHVVTKMRVLTMVGTVAVMVIFVILFF